jgi:NarL family two-component system sensor histidine kinase LiaS
MRRFLPSFRRLRWKLTLSYTLVTVAALVALELLLLGAAAAAAVVLWNRTPSLTARVLDSEVAPRLAPYLSRDTPDLAGIDRWLQDVKQHGLSARVASQAITVEPDELTRSGAQLLVLDTDLRVLGTIRQTAPPASPPPLDVASVPGLDRALPQALAGARDTDRLYARPSSDHLTVAVPIRDRRNQGAVRGALVLSTTLGPLTAPIRGVAALLGGSVLVFTLAAGLIGTLFGFFTARGLTRRLDRVAAAAAAWGEGDFSRGIHDPSADEIGQLSTRLDRMAAQLEGLIRTREQLSIVDERNRLARDLHDSVKQQVFAISMNLGAARVLWAQDPAAARSRLDSAFDLARQSQQELTTIIQTLRPVELEGKGLRQALGEYVARWQEQSRIAAACEVRGDDSLPLHVEEALFRVTQEALANVARHSRASAVRVAVTVLPDVARLEICDNGQGFDPRKQPPGVGLQSMRERVQATGGELEIASEPRGTTLTASIPAARGEETT